MPTTKATDAPSATSVPREKRVTYTIDFEPERWRRIKAIAALRGQSIRSFLHGAVDRELADARELR